MKKVLTQLMMIFSSGLAFAQSDCHVEGQVTPVLKKSLVTLATYMSATPGKIKACAASSINLLQKAPLGFKCQTSQGAIFERVSVYSFPGWKGPDGLVWSDGFCEECQQRQAEAKKTCKSLLAKLPTVADYRRGEANGFREILPNMHKRYWTSSSQSLLSRNAYYFNPDGTFGLAPRKIEGGYRCVTRK
mgnify:CR=1 FL=1